MDVALADTVALCNFFTLVVGEVVSPTVLKLTLAVDRQEADVQNSDEEQLLSSFDREFELHVMTRRAGGEVEPNKAHRCLVSPAFDGSAYSEVLAGWMARRAGWKEAYRGLAEVCALQRQIGLERFLAAVRWFEAIPTFYMPSGERLPRKLLDRAASLGERLFTRSGHPVSADRLRSLLAPLNTPSLGARLHAAIQHLEERFGSGALPSDARERVKLITRFRGAAAHGENPLTGDTINDFYDSLLLAEAISWLLTLSALPWSFDRLEGSPWHPLRDKLIQLSRLAAERLNADSLTG